MNEFTRDILEATMDILVADGNLGAEDAEGFVSDIEEDEDVLLLFSTLVEQARLAGFEQGYDEGYDDAANDGVPLFEDDE